MPNVIKYSTTIQPNTIKKGNVLLGVNNIGYGPSNVTGYWAGINPPTSGYTIYRVATETSGYTINTCETDSDVIYWASIFGNTGGDNINQALQYLTTGNTNTTIVNKNYESIVTSGLVLNLDATFVPSYPKSGTLWYDISGNVNNGTLTNGPTYSSLSGGSIVFDGVDDYVNMDSSASNIIFNSPSTINLWFRTEKSKTTSSALFQIGDGLSVTGSGTSFVVSYGDWTGALGNETFVITKYLNGSSTSTTTLYGVQEGYEYQNQWVNFCLVINNNMWSLYLNASATTLTKGSFWGGTNQNYGESISPKSVVTLGATRQNQILQIPLQGNISVFQIYNRALSLNEIQQNYEAYGKNYVTFDIQYLVVAGGGAGGAGAYPSGGGGAGGLLTGYSTMLTTNTSYSITVGAGGSASNGSNSKFNIDIAIGGGRGGSGRSGGGASGGSGGGGATNFPADVGIGNFTPAGNGTVGQGNRGGVGKSIYSTTVNNGIPTGAGGGGGAGAIGNTGTTTPFAKAGDGGAGLYFSEYTSIGGSPVGWFAGGGGGSTSYSNGSVNGIGLGGNGGGGKGSYTSFSSGPSATAGTANTGGGGGGTGYQEFTGVNGGSGVVILRIPSAYVANFSAGVSATMTWVGSYKYYRVTATSTTSETVTFS